MSIVKEYYDRMPSGEQVDMFTLTNSLGTAANIITYGGILVSLKVPDRKGRLDDIVLGLDDLDGYIKNSSPHFGAIIGRCANRIEDGSFEINGVEYKVAKNDGHNHLHGGIYGFDRKVWNAGITKNKNGECLELTYFSKDGEEGYPGNLNVKVTYCLTEDNELKIDYYAVSDKDTIVNLTNHSYFNLSGHASGDILNHKVFINADEFTVNDKYSIPTGEIAEVKGTPMDFSKLTPVGESINSRYDQIVYGKGYDHNWVLKTAGNISIKAAEVFDEKSGRIMEVYTTMPGVQFYTANFLDGTFTGKDGAVYGSRNGLCLETQYFPNAIKHKNFLSPILRAGQEYRHTTIYKFSTR